ncbi:MAG TPA: alpha/beta hydrolase [Chthoniobacteraceae bacterium]|nr:alpha/beta hydrolase [Chthoniobacteraceae bacterium]
MQTARAAHSSRIDTRRIALPHGRALGLSELGCRDGPPVFYFHGFPGSRLEAALLEETARQLGARIVALDRPGYGESDYQPGRSIAEWPRDVAAVADALRIDRFSVLGVSGGGPYALACAAGLPGRVRAAATVGGLGPMHLPSSSYGMSRRRRIGCALLRQMRWLTRPTYALLARRMRRNIDAELANLIALTCPRDQRTLARADVREILRLSFSEALRGEAKGGARDLRLYLSEWDFDVTTITQPVALWHGAEDAIVPSAMSRQMGTEIRTAETFILPEEGHYSLPIDHAPGILRRLLETAARN